MAGNRNEAVDKALKESQDAKDKYEALTKAQNEKYEKQTQEAQKKYEEETRKKNERFEKELKGLTGKTGYDKAIQMGLRGANLLAGGAQQQAQNAYRSAGLNKAQSAQLAGAQANQAYQQGFAGQQAQGASQLQNQLSALGQATGNRLNTAGTLAGQQLGSASNLANIASGQAGQSLGYQQGLANQQIQNAQQKYDNTLGLISTGLNAVGQLGQLSDERLKDSVNLSARDYCSKVGDLLDKHKKNSGRSYKDLML